MSNDDTFFVAPDGDRNISLKTVCHATVRLREYMSLKKVELTTLLQMIWNY